MRHRNKKIKLGRKKAHRNSLLANMASSLIEHKRINTTVTKAKALKRFIEPLVTKTKDDSTHNRRVVFKYLRNKESITELFRTISNKIGDRPGGYTRIIKLGKRMGDNADMALIEFVDFNELYSKSDTVKKSTRRGRSKSKSKGGETSETNSKSTKIIPKDKIKDSDLEKNDNKVPEKEENNAPDKEDKKPPVKEDKKVTEKEENKASDKEHKKPPGKDDNKVPEKED